jgi:hypothetical protein
LRLAFGGGVSYIYIEEGTCFHFHSIDSMLDVIKTQYTSSVVSSTSPAANAGQHPREIICNRDLGVVEPCSLASNNWRLSLNVASNVAESRLNANAIENRHLTVSSNTRQTNPLVHDIATSSDCYLGYHDDHLTIIVDWMVVFLAFF